MIDPKQVTAVVVTRGDVDLTEILKSLECFGHTIVWDNSKRFQRQFDHQVYGRYGAIQALGESVVYTQDDDCLLDNPAAICEHYEPGVVTCNMPPEYRRNYQYPEGIQLVGFGAIFDADLIKVLADFEHDELFMRECDRVFTAMNSTKLVDLPFKHLPAAHDASRLWKQPGHAQALADIRERIRAAKQKTTKKVDIMYLAWEREEFTRESFKQFHRNTNQSLVGKVYFYTDGCNVLGDCHGVDNMEIIHTKFGSPVAIMNDYLERSHADMFVKLDNDVIVPPGWLEEGMRLMGENPQVDLLGIEAHLRPPSEGKHGIRYTDHIGGIGFMRRRAFSHGLMQPNRKYFGFTEYQWANPQILKAWIDPPLKVFLLDHLPFEPWRSLSEQYIQKGWQRRQWGEYGPEWSELWEWWHNAGSASYRFRQYDVIIKQSRSASRFARIPSIKDVYRRALRQCPSISIDSRRQEGLPCIVGTRIPVHLVLWAIEQTGSIEGAMRSYPDLTVEQVKDAIYFAEAVLGSTNGLDQFAPTA